MHQDRRNRAPGPGHAGAGRAPHLRDPVPRARLLRGGAEGDGAAAGGEPGERVYGRCYAPEGPVVSCNL